MDNLALLWIMGTFLYVFHPAPTEIGVYGGPTWPEDIHRNQPAILMTAGATAPTFRSAHVSASGTVLRTSRGAIPCGAKGIGATSRRPGSLPALQGCVTRSTTSTSR